MKAETRARLTIALMFASVVGTAVGANAIAMHQARRAGVAPDAIATASGTPARAGMSRGIQVASVYSGTVTFADPHDVDTELRLTCRDLRRIERALSKDLAGGRLRAQRTRAAIRATGNLRGATVAARSAAAQGALLALERAMSTDIARGELTAPHSQRVVSHPRGIIAGSDIAGAAAGVVAVTEDLWRLECAFEKDIHAGDVVARETHFAIDRRRW